MSTCSIASCWSSRSPCSTTHPAAALGVGQEELGHHLVGATEVEQLDLGEVEQGGGAVRPGERRLDAVANRGARWPGDQIAIGRCDGLTQEVPIWIVSIIGARRRAREW